MKYDYDVAVIGAGSGGLTVAIGLAVAGKRVALIEKGLIGGDCTNFGCVPSKALIDIAKSGKYKSLKEALVEVRARRQIIQNEETVDEIESHGLKVFQGTASFISEHEIKIQQNPQPLSPPKEKEFKIEGEIIISAKNIVISTGSHAMTIELEGVDGEKILTNESIFEQTENIENLAIIGGGYIGCELAESIAAIGTKVSLIQRNERLIPMEEPESSELLKNIFVQKGIEVFTGFSSNRAENGKLILEEKNGEDKKRVAFDKVLLALGRIPNTKNLRLENAEIDFDKKGIIVDGYNRTSKKHIFAIGDCVKNNPQFTHLANNEGRGVIRNILVPGFLKKSVRNMTLPAVLYTHLEIARIGKTREELLKHYSENDIESMHLDFEKNDRSKVTNDTKGFVKIHFSRLKGKILGATIFGKGAGEMIGQLTLAKDNNISAYSLAKTIQAYPTKSDLIKRVADRFVTKKLKNIKPEVKYFFKSNILQLLTGLIWLALLILFFWYKVSSGQTLEEMALSFFNYLSGNTIGVVIFILAYALRPIILFPATLMTFLSGALFGLWLGVFATVTGATLSALTAYFIGMIFGKKVISGDDTGFIGKLRKDVNTSPFTSILSTRLLFFPFDLVNYACGFLKVKLPSFLLATVIGIIPGSAVFVLAGSSAKINEATSLSQAISNVDTNILFLAAGLFIVIIGITKIFKKFKK